MSRLRHLSLATQPLTVEHKSARNTVQNCGSKPLSRGREPAPEPHVHDQVRLRVQGTDHFHRVVDQDPAAFGWFIGHSAAIPWNIF